MNDAPSESPLSAESASRPNGGVLFMIWRWFWIVSLVVSFPLVWYCFYVPSNNIAWAENYSLAQQQASESGKPMLLFFTGEWCVPCRIMKRSVWADEQVTASVNEAFIPVTIDVDGPDAAAALSRYGVRTTPNTIIADPTGNVLQQKVGGMAKADFLALVKNLNRSASDAP